MDSTPTRPSTPTLDAYYAQFHGAQNPRYTESPNGVIDNALNAYNGDKAQGINDQSLVQQGEIDAAEDYLGEVEAYITQHAGFWPADGSTDHTDTSALQAENTANAAAAGATSTDPNDKPAATTDDPGALVAVVPVEHLSRLRELVDAARRDLGLAAHWALVEMHEVMDKIENL